MTGRAIVTPFPRRDKEKSVSSAPFSWEWKGVPFVRIAPGHYDAICVRTEGPDFVDRYKRWSLSIYYRLLADEVELCQYLNFGRGKAPKITRGGHYYREWCLVNGDQPTAHQQMTPDMFCEPGLILTVEVEDAQMDPKQQIKPEAQVYSRVKRLVKVVRS